MAAITERGGVEEGERRGHGLSSFSPWRLGRR
jgi:hypothetical protein